MGARRVGEWGGLRTHPAQLTLPARSADRLWAALRSKRLGGVEFIRNCAVGHRVVDFFAPRHQLAVIVDRPQLQTRELVSRGVRVVRLTSREIDQQLETTLVKIVSAVFLG